MSQLVKTDKEYAAWIESLGKQFRNIQIKAATSVNAEMLRFYWSLGRDIVKMQLQSEYGSCFLKNLSMDLKDALPNQQSFSLTNLGYMKRFYLLYSKNCPQVGGESGGDENCPQVGGNLDKFENLFKIPWGHHKYIIDKCGDDVDKAMFYVNKTVENGWSRASLYLQHEPPLLCRDRG